MTSKARVTRRIKPGKLGASGATDPYAQHACCRSHHRAMTRAMELLTFYKGVIIAEDDCVLGNGCSQYQDFGTQLCSKWNAFVVQGHATLWRSVPRSYDLLAEPKG